MKPTRALWVLTLVNLGLLAYQAVHLQRTSQGSGTILRGSGLEIVDDQGRLRVQMKLEPADAAFEMPDGTKGYPETVILRLITSDGKPRVKLTTSDEGSGLMLLGDSDATHTVLKADRGRTSLKLRNDETTEQVLAP